MDSSRMMIRRLTRWYFNSPEAIKRRTVADDTPMRVAADLGL
jgi:hypothetical protein